MCLCMFVCVCVSVYLPVYEKEGSKVRRTEDPPTDICGLDKALADLSLSTVLEFHLILPQAPSPLLVNYLSIWSTHLLLPETCPSL